MKQENRINKKKRVICLKIKNKEYELLKQHQRVYQLSMQEFLQELVLPKIEEIERVYSNSEGCLK